jgi:outer membrane receptor for ferrienterochelin and colicins
VKPITKYISYATAIAVLLLFPISVLAQHSTVKGKVTTLGEALRYAKVSLLSTKYKAVTDSGGSFTFKSVPYGKYFLRVFLSGFEQYEDSINVTRSMSELLIELKEKNIYSDEVVVTGTMKEVSRAESPVSIEVYSPTLFKKNPTPSLFEAVGMINGVRPQLNCNVCNTGDIHINGMEGPYTMVTIDGMPIVSSLSTVYGLSGIPNSVVRRVEVVKGPSSTLFGSEAVGGLINVITKDPSISPSAAVDVSASSYSEFTLDGSVTKDITPDITTLASASYFHFDRVWDINEDNFTDITLQKRFSFFNKWSFLNDMGSSDNVGFRYVYENRWGGETDWTTAYRGTDSIYGESIYTKRLELIGSYMLPITSERFVFQYSYNNHDQDSRYGNTSYIANQKIAFGQLLWDTRFGPSHDVLLGGAFRYTYYDDNTPATITSSNTYLPGIFIQDQIALSGDNALLLGLRYDYNTDHGSILTPRINYKHSFDENTVLRTSIGTGYRVVNLFTEDHAALTGARSVIVTEDLLPERSYNGNMNFVTNFYPDFGFIGFDASLFYTYFTNKITGDYTTDPNAIIYDNLDGYAVSAGMTLNTEFSFTSGLKIIAGYTWMDVYQMEEGPAGTLVRTPQYFAPKFSGTWSVSQQVPSLNMTFDWTGNINSPMYLPTQVNDYRPSHSPWFSLMNIQATYLLQNGIEFYAVVKNLLDFVPQYSLMRPFDPFDKNVTVDNPNGWTFDTEYNYAPIQGIRFGLGVRWAIQ